MTKYQPSQTELLTERQRLHVLIRKRSEEELRAVEEMSKRHLSLEQRLQLIKANKAAHALL